MTPVKPTAAAQVLVVDDDAELCGLLGEYLSARGYIVACESNGIRGLERAQQEDHSLLVLDVMLPGMDGLEVLRRLRAGNDASAHLPVVMLTAHGDEVDRIVGLELGADDYLPKPFNPRELVARIQAILRRVAIDKGLAGEGGNNQPSVQPLLRIGDLEMDGAARVLLCKGEVVDLTAMEFDLMAALMSSVGQVVTREDLARDVLKRKLLAFDRSLDMHISKLRRKLGPGAAGPDRIKTVRGVGYILVKNEPQA